MKAILMERFGGADVLSVGEAPRPSAKENEVLIKVAYTSVNPVDWKIREGYLKDMVPHKFPVVPGWDASGIIEEVGRQVRDFKVGDRVFAYCRKPEVQWGTYAEYVAMDAAAVALIPDDITFAEAASLPLVALTAWQALFDFAGLQKGNRILINGGAGGVGGVAIQLAKIAGATIYSTSSSSNLLYLKELGATRPIDYTKENAKEVVLKDNPNGIDVVFDCVGGAALEDSYDLVAKGGKLVSIVETPSVEKARQREIKSGFVFVTPNGKQLREIAAHLDEGRIMPLPLIEMRLEEAAEAQEKSRERHVRGKIVLRVS